MNEMTNGRLCLNQMEFFSAFGWHPQEHLTGGRYTVTVCFDLVIPIDKALNSLDQTIDYEAVYQWVSEIMSLNILLIEEAARQILVKLKQNLGGVCSAIEVTLTKWSLPLGNTASSSITIKSE